MGESVNIGYEEAVDLISKAFTGVKNEKQLEIACDYCSQLLMYTDEDDRIIDLLASLQQITEEKIH